MNRVTLLSALCCIAFTQGFAPAARLPCAQSGVRTPSAVAMHVPVAEVLPFDPPALLDAATTASSMPSSLLIGDVLESIAGFATSPLVLLLPIGAGSLVAAIIIYILVKSAG
jgi:hypothetical protein